MHSVPRVAITGQVSRDPIGTDAFQEADIRGITMPITKRNFLITGPADVPRTLADAFHIASSGRPGRHSSTSRKTFCRLQPRSRGHQRSTCLAIDHLTRRRPNRSAPQPA